MTGDEIKVIFATQRLGSNDGEVQTVPFQEVDYVMTEEGLAPSTEQPGQASILTKLQTWKANEMTVPFGFSKETQYLDAYKKKKQGGNTLGNVLNTDNILHKEVRLELEVRDSDFIQIKSRGHLESCFIKVQLTRDSIVDCLMAQDMSQNAQVIIQNISEDRRSLRFKKVIDLKEFHFDEEIILRLFKPDDVIQITFADELEEFFVALNCAELPLSLTQKTVWFAQIKTK